MKHFFDRTFFFFVCALVLIGIIVYNSIPSKKAASVKVAAIQNTKLTEYKDEFANIKKGDSLIIIAQDITSVRFLVQTKDGQRGFIPQDAIDNRGIILSAKKAQGLNDNSNISVNNGDTITFLERGVKGKTTDNSDMVLFQTSDGQKGWIDVSHTITLLGSKLLKYNWQGGDYYLSKAKFEKLYLGKTIDEIEQLYRPANFIKKDKDALVAKYSLRVFDKTDGKFYNPTIRFENGVAVSYERELGLKTNSFILKYLPLVSTLIDNDFFSQLISKNTFETRDLDKESVSVWFKIISYVVVFFLLIGFLAFIFFLNHVVSFLLFGLLRFRFPLIFIPNKVFPSLILVVTIIPTYIWLVLGLCYPFHWLFFIPILIAVTVWIIPKITGWFGEVPSNRCPHCKSLYIIKYKDEKQIKEYQQWRKRTKTQVVGSRTRRWQTYDRVTKKYSNGSSHSYNTNYQNHSSTVDIKNVDVYDVLFLVKDFKIIYRCEHCGFEEYGWREDLTELDRKYNSSYIE